uniref:GP35 n=1 Tax=Caviid herpesvirus 2 str. CIDMTR TaxID=1415526 RepID=U6H6N4_9BETA|nr:GP35 [Caviid herpesvirus 2 str. CIDMTR]
MSEGTSAQEPEPEIPLDENYNFSPSVLTEEDIRYVTHRLVEEPCLRKLAFFNSGIPVPAFELEANIRVDVKRQCLRISQVAEQAVKIAVCASHLVNSKLLLVKYTDAITIFMNSPHRERLETGYRRLCQALNDDSNPADMIQSLDDTYLPTSIYKHRLQHLYDLADSINIDVEDEARRHYHKLGVFNNFYKSPLFFTTEAVLAYATNIEQITRGNTLDFDLMTIKKLSKDPIDVLNDMMFILSFNHMVFVQTEDCFTLRKWIITSLNNFTLDMHTAYTQVPETRITFLNLVDMVASMINTNTDIEDDDEDSQFKPALRVVFNMLRELEKASVYVLPEFMRFASFVVLLKLLNRRTETHCAGLDLAFRGQESTADLDPSTPYSVVEYNLKNPYGNKQLFRCPRNVPKYLGEDLVEMNMTQPIISTAEDGSPTVDYYELQKQACLMMEGAAQQLRMTPEQIKAYAYNKELVAPAEAETTVTEDVLEPEDPLFANVSRRHVRQSSKHHHGKMQGKSHRTQIPNLRPYQTTKPKRHRPDVTAKLSKQLQQASISDS